MISPARSKPKNATYFTLEKSVITKNLAHSPDGYISD